MPQTVFKRIEKKYPISHRQAEALISALGSQIVPDAHHEYDIYNLYYDTDNYALIRASVEKPLFKEKLRLRSYGKASSASTAFAELKRKYDGTVYKRRVALPYPQALALLSGGRTPCGQGQVLDEIDFFLARFNNISPKVFLAYHRLAFAASDGSGLRLTLDSDIRFRQSELRLDNGGWGNSIFPHGQVLEIKAPLSMPLWLCDTLSRLNIYPASFSKYGECYTRHIAAQNNQKRGEYSA